MTLPLPVKPALLLLSHPITAYDVTSGYVDRRWVEGVPGPDYTIKGSLQPSTDKELKFLGDGNVSGGAITITTGSELFIEDTSQSDGVEVRQTYIKHSGEIWRVRAKADWVTPGTFYKWICTKVLDQQ